jgi:hypothetical protein
MADAIPDAFYKLLSIVALAVLALALVTELCAQKPSSQIASTAVDSGVGDRSPSNDGRIRLNLLLNSAASNYESDRAAGVSVIHTCAEAQARQAKVRNLLLSLIGTLPGRTPLNARVLGESKADGFRIRKVIFESQPNFPVCALIYLPDRIADGRRHPAILITPGHYQTGKASDSNTAAMFARNGFVVLSYDPIGEGERLQYPDPSNPATSLVSAPTGEHGEASLQPMLIGDAFARYAVWDAMRGIDYLVGLPEVDPKRLGSFRLLRRRNHHRAHCRAGQAHCCRRCRMLHHIIRCLLSSLGPQDAEQSTPRFISSGLDFPDLIELAAPRPYAVISTYADMFPFTGARASVAEARRFYALFDPASLGMPPDKASPSIPPIPTTPALNPDTTNRVAPTAALQFITGPGLHAALAPIMGDILGFFMRNLQPGADADRPGLATSLTHGEDGPEHAAGNLSREDLQVTSTGQMATSYPNSETVFSLNRKRAANLIPATRHILTTKTLAEQIREVTAAEAGSSTFDAALSAAGAGHLALPCSDGVVLEGDIAIPASAAVIRPSSFSCPTPFMETVQ